MDDRVITDDIDFHVYLGACDCLREAGGWRIEIQVLDDWWLQLFLDLQCLIDDDYDDDDDDDDDDEGEGLLQGHCKTTQIASEHIGIKHKLHLPIQMVSHLLIGTMTNWENN